MALATSLGSTTDGMVESGTLVGVPRRQTLNSSRMPIQDVLQAQDVTRWHIVATAKRQSLADHTFNVMAIGHEIAMRCTLMEAVPAIVMVKAFYHDLHEVTDGDTPATAKEPKPMPTEITEQIVRIADKTDAWWFIVQFGVGRRARNAVRHCEKAMRKDIDGSREEVRKAAFHVIDDIKFGKFQYEL